MMRTKKGKKKFKNKRRDIPLNQTSKRQNNFKMR